MTKLLPQARRLAVAGLATAAVLGAAASTAQAVQTKTLGYRCKYPLIGTNPLSVKIVLDVPDRWPSGEPTPGFRISAEATASGNTVPGLSLIEGLAAIEGVSTASSTVHLPQGLSVPVSVPITIPKYTLPSPVPNPLVLPASGETPSLTIDEEGPATITLDKLALNLKATDASGAAIQLPPVTKDLDANPVSDSDGNPDTFDVYCKLDPTTQDTILATVSFGHTDPCEYVGGCPQPDVPTSVTASTTGRGKAKLAWTAPSKPGSPNIGALEYVIALSDGQTITTGLTSAELTFNNDVLTTGTIRARYEGSVPQLSEPVAFKLYPRPCVPVIVPPGRPGSVPLSDGDITTTSVHLRWLAPPPPESACGGVAASYRITYGGQTVTVAAPQTDAVISGLTAGTEYAFKIEALDAAGLTSLPLTVTAMTDAAPVVQPIAYGYTLAGSATLKTLTKGTLPLKGTIDAKLTLATGAFTADLALSQTQGRLTALGFLPVTAKIGFIPSGKTTGTLLDGVLKTSSLVRIKVQEVKLFGAIPLAGGNNCQTKSLSKIDLQSTQAEFSPLDGGPIAGTFAISDLNGCGALNGLVSPLTAGGGNTINLNLVPKA